MKTHQIEKLKLHFKTFERKVIQENKNFAIAQQLASHKMKLKIEKIAHKLHC